MRDRINPYYVYLPNDRRTYGPKTKDGRNYTRDGAMTFARIGSQHGGPREVWDVPKKGGTPKLIRRYVGGQATYRGNPSVAPWRTDHLYFLFDPRTHLLYLGADDIAEFDFVEPTIYWNTEVVSLRDLGLLDIDPDDPNNWATFEDHDRLYGSPRANVRNASAQLNPRSAWDSTIDAFESSDATIHGRYQDYPWYVVYDTPTGVVIASGWDFKSDAQDAVADMPSIPGWTLRHRPVSKRHLQQLGIDPGDPGRWLGDLPSVRGVRHNKGPNRNRIEKQYQSFNHHAPKEWRDLKDVVKNAHLPTHMLPRGGVTRIWYDSDKLMEPGDRVNKVNPYVHCVLPQPQSNSSDQCVCGHPLHDHETTRAYATVYEASTSKSALAINWPEAVAFLGWSLGWDEFIGDQVKPVRFKRKALITFAPDLKTLIAVAAGKTYMIFGGEMRITPDGIAG